MSARGQIASRVVWLFVALQVLTVVFLVTVDATSSVAQAAFEVYLAVDMIAFSLVSYAYRVSKRGESANPAFFVCGAVLIGALLFAGLLF